VIQKAWQETIADAAKKSYYAQHQSSYCVVDYVIVPKAAKSHKTGVIDSTIDVMGTVSAIKAHGGNAPGVPTSVIMGNSRGQRQLWDNHAHLFSLSYLVVARGSNKHRLG